MPPIPGRVGLIPVIIPGAEAIGGIAGLCIILGGVMLPTAGGICMGADGREGAEPIRLLAEGAMPPMLGILAMLGILGMDGMFRLFMRPKLPILLAIREFIS